MTVLTMFCTWPCAPTGHEGSRLSRPKAPHSLPFRGSMGGTGEGVSSEQGGDTHMCWGHRHKRFSLSSLCSHLNLSVKKNMRVFTQPHVCDRGTSLAPGPTFPVSQPPWPRNPTGSTSPGPGPQTQGERGDAIRGRWLSGTNPTRGMSPTAVCAHGIKGLWPQCS